MSLENKLGLYAIVIILLVLCGMVVFVYPFEFLNNIDTMNPAGLPGVIMLILFKGSGVLMLYLASGMKQKHFKSINNE